MNILKIISIITIIFISVIFLVLIFQKKAIKRFIINIILGIILLVLIDLTSEFTSVYIPINKYTFLGSISFGVSGIILFLVLQLIFL